MSQKYHHIELDVRGLNDQEAEALLDVLVAITGLKVDEDQIASCVVPMDEDTTQEALDARMESDRQREMQWEQAVRDDGATEAP